MNGFYRSLMIFSGKTRCMRLFPPATAIRCWAGSRTARKWYSVLLLDTPEAMLDALIDAYSSYVEEKVTNGDRDLTEQEQKELDARCQELREKCLQDK